MADRAPAIALGQRLHFQEQTWTVVAISGTTVTLRGSSGQLLAVLVTHLLAATDFHVLDQSPAKPCPRTR